MTDKKSRYKITNWKPYNQALKNRGSLTFWIDADLARGWHQQTKTGKPGASRIYSDVAIQACLMMREVYHQPLRQTTGFIRSIFSLARINLPVPDYSTLSRRAGTLDTLCRRTSSGERPRHIVIDSTGLKVYGEGEWKVRAHGVSRRRTWRKLHLAIDADTQEILAVVLTENNVGDSEVLPELLAQLDENETVETAAADGAYDTRPCHQALLEHDIRALIPPREGAVEWPDLPDGTPHPRTKIVQEIARTSQEEWKEHSGYHRRSLAETAMFRMKRLFGGELKNRNFENQMTEAFLKTAAFNAMTRLGMPQSVKIN